MLTPVSFGQQKKKKEKSFRQKKGKKAKERDEPTSRFSFCSVSWNKKLVATGS